MNKKSHTIGNWAKRFFLAGFLLGSLVSLSSITIAQTGEPSREPILRIETGMHTGQIHSIGVDRAGKYLVTASAEDKTARVWEIQTGRLLRVLRVPIGDGNEGKLSSVAISPDGSTIALGGYTGEQWDKRFCIYLFDQDTGRLIRRLTGLPFGPLHLTFSPDGALLAATLGGPSGVRMWRTTDWVEVGRDTANGAGCTADFDRGERLVTSCGDGELRLYDREMRLLASTSMLSASLGSFGSDLK